MLSLFGVESGEVTGAASFGWRLFGVRTVAISAAALAGSRVAREAFLPVQLADQLVFAHALRSRSVAPRTAGMAIATSAAIIALDLAARLRVPARSHLG